MFGDLGGRRTAIERGGLGLATLIFPTSIPLKNKPQISEKNFRLGSSINNITVKIFNSLKINNLYSFYSTLPKIFKQNYLHPNRQFYIISILTLVICIFPRHLHPEIILQEPP